MWNLVYLELWLREQGFDVMNLGGCTPEDEVLTALTAFAPHLVVVSSVNGHGFYQAQRLIERIRRQDPVTPCVIGGKLTTQEADNRAVKRRLLEAGYAGVFVGPAAIEEFSRFLATDLKSSPAMVLMAEHSL